MPTGAGQPPEQAPGQPGLADDDHRLRADSGSKVGITQQQGVRRHSVRAGACITGGFGQQRPAERLGQESGSSRVDGAVPDHDGAALRYQPKYLLQWPRSRLVDQHLRPHWTVCSTVQWFDPVVGAVWHERLTKRHVEVHRPGVRRMPGGCQRAGRERAPVAHGAWPIFGNADVGEEPDRVAVQADLVDGLVRAGCPQLRRPVGRQDDQRDAGLRCLDHRRVQVGGSGPRRTEDRDRPSRHHREPQREKAGRTFVDANVQPDPVIGVQGQRKGRRPRPGRQHSVAYAAARHLVDEHAGQRRGRVHRARLTNPPAATAWTHSEARSTVPVHSRPAAGVG